MNLEQRKRLNQKIIILSAKMYDFLKDSNFKINRHRTPFISETKADDFRLKACHYVYQQKKMLPHQTLYKINVYCNLHEHIKTFAIKARPKYTLLEHLIISIASEHYNATVMEIDEMMLKFDSWNKVYDIKSSLKYIKESKNK